MGEAHRQTAPIIDSPGGEIHRYSLAQIRQGMWAPISRSPIISAPLRRHENHADDSKARPPDFFHPLLLHDDIRHATGSADILRTESPDFSDHLSDVMRDHICSHNIS